MTVDDGQDDHALAAVARLRTYDVSERHARRLRDRCHSRLQSQATPADAAGVANASAFRRIVGPALGGAWCLLYLAEILRRAAAFYLGAP